MSCKPSLNLPESLLRMVDTPNDMQDEMRSATKPAVKCGAQMSQEARLQWSVHLGATPLSGRNW